jgi:hypothetical protein
MSPGRRAAVGVVVAIVCASGIATADASPPQLPFPPPSAPGAPCDQHTGTTLQQTGPVVVYGTGAGTNALGQTVTRYWACTLPSGDSNWLGTRTSAGRYPANATMRRVTIAGPFAAAIDSYGVGATAKCIAGDGHFCHRPARAVVLLDANNGASSSTGPARHVGRLLVDTDAATGVAVWTTTAGRGQVTISSIVMTPQGDITTSIGGPFTHGPIDPSSLTLHGLRLRYTEHGKSHSVNVRRALNQALARNSATSAHGRTTSGATV